MNERRQAPGTVLVIGAGGFIGGFIAARLARDGWQVLHGVRRGSRVHERHCDIACFREAQWADALRGVDAVVNASGILRERGAQTFDAVHVRGPLALARACVHAGVAAFVQVSALGRPEDGAFIASKHRFDDALATLPLHSVVLRPSVVYATSGSYGGTSLLRALAALPGGLVLPGQGDARIQPVDVDDVARLVSVALAGRMQGVYEVGGPQVMTLRDYLLAWRRWLGLRDGRQWRVPRSLVAAQVAVFDRLGRGPLSRAVWRLLERGNVTAPSEDARLARDSGVRLCALDEALAARPSQVQDRWHARLYLLGPVLHVAVVLLWLLSAWAGFAAPASRIVAMAQGTLLAGWQPVMLARAGGMLDLLLGLWLATGRMPRRALELMMLSVAVYTLVFGLTDVRQWLDPLGGLAKNLVVLPALAVLWVLVDRR